MRTVYHGSIEVVEKPLVGVGRENLDFGKGFYVTDIRKQADTWAEIKAKYYFNLEGVINQYAFDFENAVKKFKYKKFDYYGKEWLHFIIDCRNGKNDWAKYDLIEGGVANDRVIDTVEAFIAGQIDEDKALGELSKHRPNNQICILNQTIIDGYFKFEKSFKLK